MSLRKLRFLVVFVFLSISSFRLADAQSTSTSKDVLSLLSTDSVAMVTLQVKSIVQDERMRMMPLEVLSAAGIERLGFDPLSIDRIDLSVAMPNLAGVQAGGLVTLNKDIPDEILQRLELDRKAEKGMELYLIPNTADVVLYKKSSRQAIIGTRGFVMKASKAGQGKGQLHDLVRGLGEPGAFSLTIAIEPLKSILSEAVQSPLFQGIPQVAKDMEQLVTKSEMVALRVQLGPKPTVAVLLQTNTPEDAPTVNSVLSRLVKLGTQSMIQNVSAKASEEDGLLPTATVAYLKRLAPEIEANTSFTIKGNRLILSLDGQQMTVAPLGVAAGLLLPAIQQAREAARGMQSSNNLKQIQLAILNFESAYKKLPSDVDVLKPGQKEAPTLLSWRVRILPYIEEGQLYNEFHRDEPWDSPHNIKLLDRMPSTFKHPTANSKPGHTVYQMPTGERLALRPGMRLSIASFVDGTSNTISVVETSDEAATPWTKPGDIDPFQNPELLRDNQGYVQAAFVDGSVHIVSLKPLEKLRALLTRDGGETVQLP
jgi:Protein of unknown function (DUF1559)